MGWWLHKFHMCCPFCSLTYVVLNEKWLFCLFIYVVSSLRLVTVLYNEFSPIFTSGIAPCTNSVYSKLSQSGAITLWLGNLFVRRLEHPCILPARCQQYPLPWVTTKNDFVFIKCSRGDKDGSVESPWYRVNKKFWPVSWQEWKTESLEWCFIAFCHPEERQTRLVEDHKSKIELPVCYDRSWQGLRPLYYARVKNDQNARSILKWEFQKYWVLGFISFRTISY